MERSIIGDIQVVLGDKLFCKQELLSQVKCVKKPAYFIYNLENIIMDCNSEPHGYGNFLQIIKADVSNPNKLEFCSAMKIALGCYLLNPSIVSEEKMENFLKATKEPFLRSLS